MSFLRAVRTPQTADWWVAASVTVDRPQIVRELQRDPMVVCDAPEAQQALAWARTVHGWDDEHTALEQRDTPVLRPVSEPLPPGVAL